jgi:hypothetical protein
MSGWLSHNNNNNNNNNKKEERRRRGKKKRKRRKRSERRKEEGINSKHLYGITVILMGLNPIKIYVRSFFRLSW